MVCHWVCLAVCDFTCAFTRKKLYVNRFRVREQLFKQGSVSLKDREDSARALALSQFNLDLIRARLPILEAAVDEAQANLASAQAALERSQSTLSETTIRSPIDGVVLRDEFTRRGWWEEVGGYEFLGSLVNAVPSAVRVRHYADIVNDKYLLRALIGATHRVMDAAYSDDQAAKATSEPKATPRPVFTCLAIPLGILSSLSVIGFFPRYLLRIAETVTDPAVEGDSDVG